MSKFLAGGLLFLVVVGSFVSGSFGPAGQFSEISSPGYGPGAGQLPVFPAEQFPLVSSYLRGAVSPALVPQTPGPATRTLHNAYVFGSLPLDLSEEMQQRVKELQTTIQQGFDTCKEMLTTAGCYWQYVRCNALQLRTAVTAALALQQLLRDSQLMYGEQSNVQAEGNAFVFGWCGVDLMAVQVKGESSYPYRDRRKSVGI
uniref:Uncharacterized protein n=1 Tax=Anopheles culicifacies TaxID=139723 RepID=A0A182MU61_9DIPT